MAELARKLCDELLGKDRNKVPRKGEDKDNNSIQKITFLDERVCPYFLSCFCPYEQFLNTKSDIGRCPFKYHEESFKAEYLLYCDDRYKEKIERQCIQLFQKLITDLEKKMQRGKGRLDVKPTEDVLQLMKPNKDINEEKIAMLEIQLKGYIDKMEEYAENGKITEAQELDQQTERIRSEIQLLRDDINPLFRQEKQMEVCEVCGALLIMDPTGGHRVDAHFEGKQHTGYSKIREHLKSLTEKYEKKSKSGSRHIRYYDDEGDTERYTYRMARSRSRSPPHRRHRH